VRFKEEFTWQGQHCIVMEYMAGGDLQQLLMKQKYEPLTMEMARSVTH